MVGAGVVGREGCVVETQVVVGVVVDRSQVVGSSGGIRGKGQRGMGCHGVHSKVP